MTPDKINEQDETAAILGRLEEHYQSALAIAKENGETNHVILILHLIKTGKVITEEDLK